MTRRTIALIFATLWPASLAQAQVGAAFEFSFSNPGARSLGFGGAFVALADDATAAFANPAGLVQLSQPEIGLEGRSWRYSTPYSYSGRAQGQPTGLGIDTQTGVTRKRSEADISGLSFLSFVYPRERWSVAVYRHDLANFEAEFETQGIFADGVGPASTVRAFDRRSATDLEIVSHGVAGSFRVTEKLSIGMGVVHFDGVLQSTQGVFFWDADTLQSYFARNSYLPTRLLGISETIIDDTDWGLTAGLLWRINEHWQMGAVYRQGPTFNSRFTLRAGPASELLTTPLPEETVMEGQMSFPDVAGLGLSYRGMAQRLTLSFEWDHVEYSAIFGSLGETTSQEFIPDADELHLGGEYLFMNLKPILALRAGVWLDPAHGVQANLDNPFTSALFAPSEDNTHYSLGLGAAFARFQVDLGADFSNLRDTISLSAIYTF